MTTPRVAVMGPFETASLRPFLAPDSSLDDMPPGMGGSCIVNLVTARIDRNLPTDVITLDPTAKQAITRYDGEKVRLWIVRRRERRALRDGYRVEVAGLHDALRESGADLCHANWTYEYGLAAVTQHAIPSVITVHDHAGKMLRHLGWRYLPHYFMAGDVMRRARHLTAVSPHIVAYVLRRCGKKATLIPNTMPDAIWSMRPEATTGEVVFVSALTWARFRNAETSMRAFAQIRSTHPGASYILLGPGFEPDGPARRWAASAGIDDGLVFRGRVPYPDALRTIASASVLVHPSLEESFGGPVAEAMALGVPVVATREAGGPAWLLADTCGRIVHGKSVSAMADAMLEAAGSANPSPRDAARTRIRQLCDPDSVLKSWGTLYGGILEKA